MLPSEKIARLNQISGSSFGRSFLAYLAGIEISDLLFSEDSEKLIKKKLKDFKADKTEAQFTQEFIIFIREYSFGEFSAYRKHSVELANSREELATVFTGYETFFINSGFFSPFDVNRQYSYLNEHMFSKNLGSTPSNWWVFPPTLWTIQSLGQNIENEDKFPLDEAFTGFEFREFSHINFINRPCVYEIFSEKDWVRLVTDFGVAWNTQSSSWQNYDFFGLADVELQRLTIPNWEQVASKFDGVYLSPAAYLETSYKRIDLDSNKSSVLTGWSPGATFWLRPETIFG